MNAHKRIHGKNWLIESFASKQGPPIAKYAQGASLGDGVGACELLFWAEGLKILKGVNSFSTGISGIF